MSAKQTEFIAISGWPTTADYYASAAGALSNRGIAFTLSAMVQGRAAMEAGETEVIASCFNEGALTGFCLVRTQSDDYMKFILELGESPDPIELPEVSFELATVIGRPLILTITVDDDALVAYANGGLVLSTTLAASYAPANTARFQIGGAGNQLAGTSPTTRTGILGVGYTPSALDQQTVGQHAVACMNAHRFVSGPNAMQHAWSLSAPRDVPSTLADIGTLSGGASLIDLVAVGDLPTARMVTDVGYGSPRYFVAR